MDKARTCIVCGKKYNYCPHCRSYNPYETWRMIYCSNNCRNVFHIFDDYRANKVDAKEAYEKISKYNLDNLTDLVNDTVKEIVKKGKPKKKRKIVNND